MDWLGDRYDDATSAAQDALEYWAERSVDADDPFDQVFSSTMGSLAALATRENAPKTAATLIPGGRIAGKIVARCKGSRIFRVEKHGPHHTFKRRPLNGKRKHIQAWTYRKGVRRSGSKPVRIPYGRRYGPPTPPKGSSGMPHNKI